jgi:hypothetical protein
MILLAAVAATLSACGGGGDGESSGPAPTSSHLVEYVVTGSGSSDVTLQNPGVGSTQVSGAASGFTRSYTCHSGDFLYVSAQTNGSNSFSYATVSIKLDGAMVKTNTANGAFSIASASASC